MRRSRPRRGRRVLLSAAPIAAGLALLAWLAWPHDDLLARSTRVAPTAGWSGGKRFHLSMGIRWLSDHEVLFDRFSSPNREGDRVAYARNVRSGREEALPRLSEHLDEHGEFEVADSQAASPDGRWFVRSDRWGGCVLMEVRGGRTFSYATGDGDAYRGVVWMPDGRHWLEVFRMNGMCRGVILHDVANPRLSEKLTTFGARRGLGFIEAAKSADEAVELSRPNEVNIAVPLPARPPEVTVRRVSLRMGKSLEEYAVPVPYGDERFGCLVSPRGDRLAWLVSRTVKPFGTRLLERLFPNLAKEMTRTELWVSGLDGRDMRLLGQLSRPRRDGGGGPEPLTDLQWLPGARSLSFIHDRQLYTIPTD